MQRNVSPEARSSWALSRPSARFPAESWFWGLCILGALTILVPFELLYRTPQLDFGLPILMALLSTTYSGTHLALLAIGGRKKLFSLTFWVFSYVWLGLVPLVQLATENYPWPGGYDEWVSAYTLVIVLVGFVAVQQLGGPDVILGATRYSLDQAADPEASKAADLIWGTLLRVPAFISLL